MSLDLTKQDPTGETQVKAAFELSWNTLETEVQTFAYYLSLLAFAPFNYGKSTLLNALLGEKTLPIDLIPTTGAAIYVKYGDK